MIHIRHVTYLSSRSLAKGSHGIMVHHPAKFGYSTADRSEDKAINVCHTTLLWWRHHHLLWSVHVALPFWQVGLQKPLKIEDVTRSLLSVLHEIGIVREYVHPLLSLTFCKFYWNDARKFCIKSQGQWFLYKKFSFRNSFHLHYLKKLILHLRFLIFQVRWLQ